MLYAPFRCQVRKVCFRAFVFCIFPFHFVTLDSTFVSARVSTGTPWRWTSLFNVIIIIINNILWWVFFEWRIWLFSWLKIHQMTSHDELRWSSRMCCNPAVLVLRCNYASLKEGVPVHLSVHRSVGLSPVIFQRPKMLFFESKTSSITSWTMMQ